MENDKFNLDLIDFDRNIRNKVELALFNRFTELSLMRLSETINKEEFLSLMDKAGENFTNDQIIRVMMSVFKIMDMAEKETYKDSHIVENAVDNIFSKFRTIGYKNPSLKLKVVK